MKSFEVPADVVHAINALAKNPTTNMAVQVSAHAQSLLPGYSRQYRTAADAVPSGAGTCYANAEVVAKVGEAVPGMRNFIVLFSKPQIHSMHGENFVIDKKGNGTVINNAGSSPVTTMPNPGTPEALILSHIRKGGDETIAYGAMDRHFNWRTCFLDDVTDPTPEYDDGFSPTAQKLVIPAEIGLRVMSTVAEARAIFREGDQGAYQTFITEKADFIPSFDITPKVESMAGQAV